jgi:hypothetical protein
MLHWPNCIDKRRAGHPNRGAARGGLILLLWAVLAGLGWPVAPNTNLLGGLDVQSGVCLGLQTSPHALRHLLRKWSYFELP